MRKKNLETALHAKLRKKLPNLHLRKTQLNPDLGENLKDLHQVLHHGKTPLNSAQAGTGMSTCYSALLNSVLGENLEDVRAAPNHQELECQRPARRKQALSALPPTVPPSVGDAGPQNAGAVHRRSCGRTSGRGAWVMLNTPDHVAQSATVMRKRSLTSLLIVLRRLLFKHSQLETLRTSHDSGGHGSRCWTTPSTWTFRTRTPWCRPWRCSRFRPLSV